MLSIVLFNVYDMILSFSCIVCENVTYTHTFTGGTGTINTAHSISSKTAPPIRLALTCTSHFKFDLRTRNIQKKMDQKSKLELAKALALPCTICKQDFAFGYQGRIHTDIGICAHETCIVRINVFHN